MNRRDVYILVGCMAVLLILWGCLAQVIDSAAYSRGRVSRQAEIAAWIREHRTDCADSIERDIYSQLATIVERMK